MAEVKVKLKSVRRKGLDISGADLPGYTNALVKAMKDVDGIKEDISTICDAGIQVQQLAYLLGYKPWTVWAWKKGYYHPPFVVAQVIKGVAASIRQLENQKQEELEGNAPELCAAGALNNIK